jgi:hypothetical protein
MASSENNQKKDSESSWKDVPWGFFYPILIITLLYNVPIFANDGAGVLFLIGWLWIIGWRSDFKANKRLKIEADESVATAKAKELAAFQVKEAKRMKALERRQEKRKRERKKERAEKQRLRNNKIAKKAYLRKEAQKPKLSALEAAKLALGVVDTISLEELRAVIDILKSPKEIAEVLQNANNELVDRYSEEIEAIYASRRIMPSEPFYDIQLKADLERCMSLGMNSIEKRLELEDIAGNVSGKKLELEDIAGNVFSNVSGRKIEHTKKWKDIQKNLK